MVPRLDELFARIQASRPDPLVLSDEDLNLLSAWLKTTAVSLSELYRAYKGDRTAQESRDWRRHLNCVCEYNRSKLGGGNVSISDSSLTDGNGDPGSDATVSSPQAAVPLPDPSQMLRTLQRQTEEDRQQREEAQLREEERQRQDQEQRSSWTRAWEAFYDWPREANRLGRQPDSAGFQEWAALALALGQELNTIDSSGQGEIRLREVAKAGVPQELAAAVAFLLLCCQGNLAEITDQLEALHRDPKLRMFVLWLPFVCDFICRSDPGRLNLPPAETPYEDLVQALAAFGCQVSDSARKNGDSLPLDPVDRMRQECEQERSVLSLLQETPCSVDWQQQIDKLWDKWRFYMPTDRPPPPRQKVANWAEAQDAVDTLLRSLDARTLAELEMVEDADGRIRYVETPRSEAIGAEMKAKLRPTWEALRQVFAPDPQTTEEPKSASPAEIRSKDQFNDLMAESLPAHFHQEFTTWVASAVFWLRERVESGIASWSAADELVRRVAARAWDFACSLNMDPTVLERTDPTRLVHCRQALLYLEELQNALKQPQALPLPPEAGSPPSHVDEQPSNELGNNARPGAADSQVVGVQTPALPRAKRSTVVGEGRAKLIAALTRHHQYAKDSCPNTEPIGNNELARQADVSDSTASAFFKKEFDGWEKYRALCLRSPTELVAALKLLNGEYTPQLLYGKAPPGEIEHSGDE